jgi:hypothetical protein
MEFMKDKLVLKNRNYSNFLWQWASKFPLEPYFSLHRNLDGKHPINTQVTSQRKGGRY